MCPASITPSLAHRRWAPPHTNTSRVSIKVYRLSSRKRQETVFWGQITGTFMKHFPTFIIFGLLSLSKTVGGKKSHFCIFKRISQEISTDQEHDGNSGKNNNKRLLILLFRCFGRCLCFPEKGFSFSVWSQTHAGRVIVCWREFGIRLVTDGNTDDVSTVSLQPLTLSNSKCLFITWCNLHVWNV